MKRTNHNQSSHQFQMPNGGSSGRLVKDLRKLQIRFHKHTQTTSHSGKSRWTPGEIKWLILLFLQLRWLLLEWAFTRTHLHPRCTKDHISFHLPLQICKSLMSALPLQASITTSISSPSMERQDIQACSSGQENGKDSPLAFQLDAFFFRQASCSNNLPEDT